MLAAVKQAQAEFTASNGTKKVLEVNTAKVIGDGYYKDSTVYAKATSIKVILDAKGLPITAYPVLP